MIRLSYSTVNNCLQPENSHNWLNKMMGLVPEERLEWNEGKEGHKVVQLHLCGKKTDKRLSHIKYSFPIVEEKDFDERCKFEFQINNYQFIGYYDGLNRKDKRVVEIKLSSNPWSLMQFQNLIQRKIFSLANVWKETICITGYRDMKLWKDNPLKYFTVPTTKKDEQDAANWILSGIEVLESGNFKGGLNEFGKCTDPRCYFGANCNFR